MRKVPKGHPHRLDKYTHKCAIPAVLCVVCVEHCCLIALWRLLIRADFSLVLRRNHAHHDIWRVQKDDRVLQDQGKDDMKPFVYSLTLA